MMTTPTTELTSIDLSPFLADEGVIIGDEPTTAQLETAAAMDASCREHGFMYVVNFGVTPALRDAAFATSKELFNIPNEHKMECLSRINPKSNMGYAPFGLETLNRSRPPDLKEAFNVRFEPAHTNCFDGCPESFASTAMEFQKAIEKAAHRFAIACALALKVEPDFFDRTLTQMNLCTTRYLHYPPCATPTAVDGEPVSTAIRLGEHTDFGAYTFLLLGEGAKGLQIKSVAGGEVGGAFGGEQSGWRDVVPPVLPEGQVGALVNTGAALARWTNDVWKATAHRVIVPDQEVASSDRWSIACFIDPDAEAEVAVDPRFVAEGELPRYPPTTGLAYLLGKLNEAQLVATPK